MATVTAPTSQRGFALLIAVIFMSVMLSFALTIGALGYKQAVLAGAAVESQYAFYAADAALECALYNDAKSTTNPFKNDGTEFICGDSPHQPTVVTRIQIGLKDYYKATTRSSINLDGGTRCADITVYKPVLTFGTTWLFSQGYNLSCSDLQLPKKRFASRGLQAQY